MIIVRLRGLSGFRPLRLARTFAAADYYRLLGVDRKATTEQIKEAYLRLAKLYHPDLVDAQARTVAESDQDAAQRFVEISEAYSVLTNLDRRAQYDYDHVKHPEVLRENIAEVRDVDGVPLARKQNLERNQYADEYRARIQQERKNFNLDENGLFKGGLPQHGKGKVR